MRKSKLPPVEMMPTGALKNYAKNSEEKKEDKKIVANDFLKRWHERQVKLAQMPFWTFNFKKYL